MLQNFDALSSPEMAAPRIARLRNSFGDFGIDAVLVPRADEYMGEYVPASAERLSWLTSFTGSAGAVLVLRETAHLFVDGRYTAQAKAQTDPNVFAIEDLIGNPPTTFLRALTGKGPRLGIDPWTFSGAEIKRLESALSQTGGELVLLEHNPVDAIWDDRPAPPMATAEIQPLEFAGELAKDKIGRLRSKIAAEGAGAAILSDPASVAWTFNLRGADLPSTPHPLSRAILFADREPAIFIDERKLNIELKAYLTQLGEIRQPEEFESALSDLGLERTKVMVDPEIAPHAIAMLLEKAGADIIKAADPARLPRAIKNEAEISSSAKVHKQDGAAMVRYLAWLDRQEPGSLDEIGAAMQLEEFRRQTGESMQMPLKALAFETISGAGPNGAIIHYRVNRKTNRKLQAGELFLVDSGGQYQSGTTDITRTVALGAVGEEPKRFFTFVLKGMIAISRLRFPEGTRGLDIDAFARHALWQVGCDYGHGTGHGVGSYLSVHEGPQSLSRRGNQELLPGMILSNEPGYYRDGAFGIRIENLIYVKPATAIEGGDRPMLGFETLTLCPIDKRLIVPDLLDTGERNWLNAYHSEVATQLMPLLDEEADRVWLKAATEAL